MEAELAMHRRANCSPQSAGGAFSEIHVHDGGWLNGPVRLPKIVSKSSNFQCPIDLTYPVSLVPSLDGLNVLNRMPILNFIQFPMGVIAFAAVLRSPSVSFAIGGIDCERAGLRSNSSLVVTRHHTQRDIAIGATQPSDFI
jgi:hypothetical protein